jgi:hypothetical protein
MFNVNMDELTSKFEQAALESKILGITKRLELVVKAINKKYEKYDHDPGYIRYALFIYLKTYFSDVCSRGDIIINILIDELDPIHMTTPSAEIFQNALKRNMHKVGSFDMYMTGVIESLLDEINSWTLKAVPNPFWAS